jgi:C-terminal processing protease CtpA/Prc
MKRVILILLWMLTVSIFTHPVQAQPIQGLSFTKTSASDSIKIMRLASLCKLWGTIKYFHPYLAYRTINWDSAFVAAAKDVDKSKSSDDYKNAIRNMLRSLNDPTTRVLDFNVQKSVSTADSSPRWRFTSDSILVVTVDRYADLIDYGHAMKMFSRAGDEIPKSRGVLFDLRSVSPLLEDERGNLEYSFNRGGLQYKLSRSPLIIPAQRQRMHLGFSPQDPNLPGGDYTSAFYALDGRTVIPDSLASDKPIVFLLNGNSEVPTAALALQSANKGAIVIEGFPLEGSYVNTQRFDAGEGVLVDFRLGELIYQDGSAGVEPVIVPSGEHQRDESFKVAIDLARKGVFQNTQKPSLPACAQFTPDNPYKEMAYPPTELRLLAAARIWVTINYFFPYKHLMNEDWNKTLEEFIPKFMAAKDSIEYTLTVAEMITRIHDSHGFVESPALDHYFGVAHPPLIVKFVENHPVVVSFLNDSIALKSGIQIGDIIEEVDGEKADTRLKRYEQFIAASTDQALRRDACLLFLNGEEGSIATLTVCDTYMEKKVVHLIRKRTFHSSGYWRNGDIIKLMPDNIGYADLDRLQVSMVDSMFDLFKNTKAIIFDVRGYPQGTVYQIAPRLTEKSEVVAAVFYRPTVMFPDGKNGDVLRQTSTYSFTQALPSPAKWQYKGMTVMLIDERTQSHAEHTGLFLRAANGTKFVGSPTAGANGGITNFVVPGGIGIMFSGQEVTHPDGTQLQRVGLVPDVEVEPTINGIRAGKDEVLEKAIGYIEEELSKEKK